MELFLTAAAGILIYKYLTAEDDSPTKTGCDCDTPSAPEALAQPGDGSAEAQTLGGAGTDTNAFNSDLPLAPDEPATQTSNEVLESSRLRMVTLASAGSFQGPTADSLESGAVNDEGFGGSIVY